MYYIYSMNRIDKIEIENKVIANLMEKAGNKFGNILPCPGKTWSECISNSSGKIMLWFYIDNGSKSSGLAMYNKFTKEYSV